MKNKIIYIFLIFNYLFPLVSNGNVLSDSSLTNSNFKKFENSKIVYANLTHRHEINIDLFEIGFKAMPKMNNYSSIPFFSSIGYAFRPSKPSGLEFKPHLFLQTSVNVSAYDYNSWYSGSKVSHTMVFDNGSETNVDVHYTNFLSQYLLGLKFNAFEKEIGDGMYLSAFIEGNVGLAHVRTRMVIPEPGEGWSDCEPVLDERLIFKYTGTIYKTGLGFGFGSYRNGGFLYFKVGYLGSFKPFEYTNQNFLDNKPRTAQHDTHNNQTHHSGARDINADFINVFTSDVHSHKISEVYYSHLRFIYLNLGVTLMLEK